MKPATDATESESGPIWNLSDKPRSAGLRLSVQLRANSADDARRLADVISTDEQFGLAAWSEPKYYADQASAGMAIKIVGRMIALILTVGAMFAVANTMYAAVASRGRDRHPAGRGI